MHNKDHITIVAFCGPSGSGKSVLVDELRSAFPDNILKWTQVTTRKRRNGVDDYMFVSKAKYDLLAPLLTCRTSFNGEFYGTMPEPTPPENAVVTIANAEGLVDLNNSVKAHNVAVHNGDEGIFGNALVRLVTIFVTYTVSEQTADARGRSHRSTESIKNEQIQLLSCGIPIDEVIDTDHGWPSAEDVFNRVIWPAITEAYNGEQDLRDEIAQLCELISMNLEGMSVTSLTGVRDAVKAIITDILPGISDISAGDGSGIEKDLGTVTVDAVDAALAAPIEQVPTAVETSDPIHDAVEEDTALTEPSDAVNDRIQNIVSTDTEEKVVDTEVSTEQDKQEPLTESDEKIAQAAKPVATIFSENPFTDWMDDSMLGEEIFINEAALKTAVREYITHFGGVPPADMPSSTQRSKDSAGGTILGFTIHIENGTFNVEYNTRLKRPLLMEFN